MRNIVTNAGVHDGTTVYYYNGWQIVETRDGSGNLTMQAYHGTQYIDEIVGLRLQHGRIYVHQDANWNVTSLTDLSGKVLERYHYSPYGELEVVAETYFGDYNADGFVDADDATNLCTNGCTCAFTSSVSGDCGVFDFDSDRDLDETDQDTLRSLYTGLSSAMQNRRIPSASFSPSGNSFAHQGLALDPELGLYQNRMRQYHPEDKRFTQRDPLASAPQVGRAYQDGLNLLALARSNPLVFGDPSGLECTVQIDGNCAGKAYPPRGTVCKACEGVDSIPDDQLGPGRRACLKRRCESSSRRGKISCDENFCRTRCPGAMGCAVPCRRTIWLCDDKYDECEDIDTIFHEFAHSCRASEEEARKIGKWFGDRCRAESTPP